VDASGYAVQGTAEARVEEAAIEAAKAARLRYVSDKKPGITRHRTGVSFSYRDPAGKVIRDERTLARIKKLAIPPAWEEVWICPDANGHIQAVGRDARGRKQYRYHERWREVRDETKFEKMLEFGKRLPAVRARVDDDLRKPGVPREKVLATVVRLLETTLIRIGNDEYAKRNGSYGLTTLRNSHAKVRGRKVVFNFKGKSGIRHSIDVDDRRLAQIVDKCRDLPGQELFAYVDDDGEVRDVGSADVNDYLGEIAGEDVTAKDFRTWAATTLAALALQELEEVDTNAKQKKNIRRAVEAVASLLGNTVTVCRKCYIHPAIFDGYIDGSLKTALRRRIRKEMRENLGGMKPEEAAVLAFLERRLATSGPVTAASKKPRRAAGRALRNPRAR
jgi:DNA topoisomerase-1